MKPFCQKTNYNLLSKKITKVTFPASLKIREMKRWYSSKIYGISVEIPY